MTRLAFIFATLFSVAEAQYVERLESDMLELVNRDRSRHSLPALKLDKRVISVARSHSKDMAVNGFFGHKSLTTGQVADRYHEARIAAARMSENIALHQEIRGAQRELMKSPGHRKNLLDPKVTHIGIGIYKYRGDLYITQNFLLPLKEQDLSNVSQDFLTKLNGLRESKRLPPLVLDEAITEIAEANSQVMHKKDDLGGDVAQKGMRKLKSRYRSYGMLFHFAKELDSLLTVDALMNRKMTSLGLGVVKNENKESGYGMLWVTVVVAQKR